MRDKNYIVDENDTQSIMTVENALHYLHHLCMINGVGCSQEESDRYIAMWRDSA